MDWRIGARFSLVAILIGIPVLIYLAPVAASYIVMFFLALMPLWLPALLVLIGWPLWLTYVRSQYASSIEYVTLELKPGDNTPKSAKPMELVFYSLYHRVEQTLLNTLLLGVVRMPWCFEIAATGGVVRFFMHVPIMHRSAIEGRLRAEYRDIDIDEARDYSREIPFSPFGDRLVMREYTLSKPDPYPLATYESHEHEKVRRDVFNEMLEDLSQVGEGEELWISLMMRPHQREWGNGYFDVFKYPIDTLHEDARVEIQKLIGVAGDVRGLPAHLQRVVRGIEEALQKPSFDCGLRALYRATNESWNEARAESLDTLFERFNDPDLNGFVAYSPREQIQWPMSDVLAAVPQSESEYYLRLYRRRAFFAPPYYGKTFVLNAEEIATLFHIPKVGRASALSRSRGKRLEPPENLPI